VDFDEIAYVLGFDRGEKRSEPFKGFKVAADLRVRMFGEELIPRRNGLCSVLSSFEWDS